jgi:hypothetical protein
MAIPAGPAPAPGPAAPADSGPVTAAHPQSTPAAAPPADAAPVALTAFPALAADAAAAAVLGAGAAQPPDAVTAQLAAITAATLPALHDATRQASGDAGHATAGPAQQIAAGMDALTRTAGGNRQLVVRLDPPELGRVQIAIAQPKSGPAAVVLTVERPETLLLVLRDQPSLHQALDRAGVAADARTVSFELAPVRTDPHPTVPHGGHGRPGDATLDLTAREQGGRSARQDPRASAYADPLGSGEVGDPLVINLPPAWSRAGIDITA